MKPWKRPRSNHCACSLPLRRPVPPHPPCKDLLTLWRSYYFCPSTLSRVQRPETSLWPCHFCHFTSFTSPFSHFQPLTWLSFGSEEQMSSPPHLSLHLLFLSPPPPPLSPLPPPLAFTCSHMLFPFSHCHTNLVLPSPTSSCPPPASPSCPPPCRTRLRGVITPLTLPGPNWTPRGATMRASCLPAGMYPCLTSAQLPADV